MGYHLTKALMAIGHEVTVVEKDSQRCESIQDELGSISTGKRADFVVMDNNLLTAPTGKIGSTRILQTNLSGKAHFSTL